MSIPVLYHEPDAPGRIDLSAGDGGAALGGTGSRDSLVERGYVPASFGGVPVLVGPELAAELKTIRHSRERRS